MILSANEILDIRTLSLIKNILQPNLIVSFESITSALWVNPRLINCLPAAVFEQGTDTMCFLLIFSNLDCYCSMTANHPSFQSQPSSWLHTPMAPANSCSFFFISNTTPIRMDKMTTITRHI